MSILSSVIALTPLEPKQSVEGAIARVGRRARLEPVKGGVPRLINETLFLLEGSKVRYVFEGDDAGLLFLAIGDRVRFQWQPKNAKGFSFVNASLA